MKTITQEQMDNLIMLRDVIEAKLGQPETVLNTYLQPCGTYGCVAGDFALRRGFVGYEAKSFAMDIHSTETNERKEIFGYSMGALTHNGYVDIFGMAHEGTIQQRLDLVNNLIANSKVETSEEDKAKAFIESLKQFCRRLQRRRHHETHTKPI